ncbi:hypothetical protein BGY98DRAFT_965938 [Russula aff. rugulosa BPL654]|nr:hypothetical protein BGY98DRAFT_965938 [Russula aff. rugulosa BPL654]
MGPGVCIVSRRTPMLIVVVCTVVVSSVSAPCRSHPSRAGRAENVQTVITCTTWDPRIRYLVISCYIVIRVRIKRFPAYFNLGQENR